MRHVSRGAETFDFGLHKSSFGVEKMAMRYGDRQKISCFAGSVTGRAPCIVVDRP